MHYWYILIFFFTCASIVRIFYKFKILLSHELWESLQTSFCVLVLRKIWKSKKFRGLANLTLTFLNWKKFLKNSGGTYKPNSVVFDYLVWYVKFVHQNTCVCLKVGKTQEGRLNCVGFFFAHKKFILISPTTRSCLVLLTF
jgi:hypothetical protein